LAKKTPCNLTPYGVISLHVEAASVSFNEKEISAMSTLQQGVLAMLGIGVVPLLAVGVQQATSPTRPTNTAGKKTGYAPVNGLKMYYEIRGEGRPAVFIHPAVGESGLIPDLPKNRQWILMDLQGHGRTADIDRPMSCDQHADDIAALLKYLKIDQADFVGDSFGGTIAVMMAVRHPKLVRRVVSHGGSLAPYPGTVADRPPADADYVKWQREEYQKVAPDPKQWPTLYDKATKSLFAWKGFSPAQLKVIKTPVLIAGGDHDLLPLESLVEWSRMIPNAQLAIIPDASHFMLFSEPERLMPTIAAFLDAPTDKVPMGMANGYYPRKTR
jgi:pimeloyl-ACP methyl ester carboxylesterase